MSEPRAPRYPRIGRRPEPAPDVLVDVEPLTPAEIEARETEKAALLATLATRAPEVSVAPLAPGADPFPTLSAATRAGQEARAAERAAERAAALETTRPLLARLDACRAAADALRATHGAVLDALQAQDWDAIAARLPVFVPDAPAEVPRGWATRLRALADECRHALDLHAHEVRRLRSIVQGWVTAEALPPVYDLNGVRRDIERAAGNGVSLGARLAAVDALTRRVEAAIQWASETGATTYGNGKAAPDPEAQARAEVLADLAARMPSLPTFPPLHPRQTRADGEFDPRS